MGNNLAPQRGREDRKKRKDPHVRKMTLILITLLLVLVVGLVSAGAQDGGDPGIGVPRIYNGKITSTCWWHPPLASGCMECWYYYHSNYGGDDDVVTFIGTSEVCSW